MNSKYSKFSFFILALSLLYCAIVMTFILLKEESDNSDDLISLPIEEVSKSVVSIHVIQYENSARNRYDPWERFWKNYPGGKSIENMGSGLILDSDGYIVTNYHVVEDASKVFVQLYNGESYDVELNNIFIDKLTDIAVIKINAKNLNIPKIGNSDKIKVGEDVFALGNPLGLFNISNKLTVTKGIISAKNADFGFNEDYGSVYQDMIQTDASINPGSSGGPLLNLDGKIIGLNTFIITASNNQSGSIGLNFAIPINRVIEIYDDLKDNGSIDRQFNTGIKVREIDAVIMRYLRLNSTDGVIVVDIEDKSSGEKAGLKIGDIILKVNDKTVSRLKDIKKIIDEDLLKTGDEIKLIILRNNNEYELNLSLEKGGF